MNYRQCGDKLRRPAPRARGVELPHWLQSVSGGYIALGGAIWTKSAGQFVRNPACACAGGAGEPSSTAKVGDVVAGAGQRRGDRRADVMMPRLRGRAPSGVAGNSSRDRTPVGIVTDRDLVVRALARGCPPTQTAVRG